MLTYSSTNSFQSDDRTPDFSKSAHQCSPSHSAPRTHDHGFLEFDATDNGPVDDETASSGTNAGEHGYDRVVGPNTSRRRRFPPASLRSTQSEEVLPSQVSRRFPAFENSRSAISGAELLKLEGKITGQTVPLTLPLKSPSVVAGVTPSLRRKSRFSTETMRQRNHQISKSGADRAMDSPKTMRASYRYQQEMTSSLEWTQENYEQIMLQARASSPPITSLPPETSSSFSSPDAYSYLEQQSPRHLTFARHQEARSKESANPEHNSQRQPSTGQITSPSANSLNLTDHSNWPPDAIYSCYGRFGPSQSAPSLAQTQTTDPTSTHTGMTQGVHQYHDRVVADHPPHNDYYLVMREQFQPRLTDADIYPAKFPATAAATPSPSTLSFQPPQSPHLSKYRGGLSRTSRRKSSSASLRSANNNSTMGFVNYTPGDSQKILAGVAPSGSSKTKARREQEALERKRKLGLAAEKAVKEAGGDVEQLRASGLLT
ncbi:hypothetical protein MMC31_001156 [Peltigera leucophlebia]|nr:hypothetical protein [Peltigera leucophlebia]